MGTGECVGPAVGAQPETEPPRPRAGDLVVVRIEGAGDVFGVRQEPSREPQVKARRRHRAVAAVRAFAVRHGLGIWAEDRNGNRFQLLETYRAEAGEARSA